MVNFKSGWKKLPYIFLLVEDSTTIVNLVFVDDDLFCQQVQLHSRGGITKEELRMMQGALELHRLKVKDVMTPLDQVVLIRVGGGYFRHVTFHMIINFSEDCTYKWLNVIMNSMSPHRVKYACTVEMRRRGFNSQRSLKGCDKGLVAVRLYWNRSRWRALFEYRLRCIRLIKLWMPRHYRT